MSGFSAWTFTGAAGVAYRSGIAAIGLYIGNGLSFLLGYFIFAERWRRSRITTVMEYLAGRFNLATHQVFSWSTIFFQLFTSASTLFGLSLFVSAACGFPVTWTIVGAGALIVFYCVLGGLWAVVRRRERRLRDQGPQHGEGRRPAAGEHRALVLRRHGQFRHVDAYADALGEFVMAEAPASA